MLCSYLLHDKFIQARLKACPRDYLETFFRDIGDFSSDAEDWVDSGQIADILGQFRLMVNFMKILCLLRGYSQNHSNRTFESS